MPINDDPWTWVALAAVAVAGASHVMERRRAARADLNDVGLIGWPTVQMTALMVAVLAAIVVFHGG